MNKEQRKELISSYKQQKVTGGVYAIRNRQNGCILIKGDVNLEAAKNRYEFAVKTNSCITPKMRADWERDGASAFAFEVLETTELQPEETAKQFRDRLKKAEERYRADHEAALLY